MLSATNDRTCEDAQPGRSLTSSDDTQLPPSKEKL
jgi:hypothetical protein